MFSFLKKVRLPQKAFARVAFALSLPFFLTGALFVSCDSPVGPGTNPIDAATPTITAQPEGGNWDVGTNDAFPLMVIATRSDGGTLSYQWYSTDSTINITDGTAIGTNSATLTLNKADYNTEDKNGSHYFYVIVTNRLGNKDASITSNVVTVIVNGAGGVYLVNAEVPVIETEPEGGIWDQSDKSEFELTVSAGVDDDGELSYQWYSTDSNTNTTDGEEIDGAEASTLTLSKRNYAEDGDYHFYVIITNKIEDNGDGGVKTASVTSTIATVTVTGSGVIDYNSAIELTEDRWEDGNFSTPTSIDVYKFDVSSEETYYVWWDQSGSNGGGSKTGQIQVRAAYDDETEIFGWQDNGWTDGDIEFTPAVDGTVYLIVRPYDKIAASIGTYGIVYSTDTTIPIKDTITFEGVSANNVTNASVITAVTLTLTLTFDKAIPGLSADDITLSGVDNVSKGTLSGSGPTYYLPIGGFATGGTLSVAVEKILYDMSGSPQDATITGAGTNINTAVPLVERQWANGDLSTAADSDWYTVEVTSGTTYYFWWNEKDGTTPQGNGTKTGDVDVIPYYADASGITNWTTANQGDRAWDTAKSFTADRTGTVFVRVRPFNNTAGMNYEGTYGIVYSTVNDRPVVRNPNDVPVTFVSVTPVNSPGTTALTLTFSEPITGLSAADISLSGIFNLTKGTLSGNGSSYTLPISGFPDGGTLTVKVEKAGFYISGSSKTVTIVSSINVTTLVENQWVDSNSPTVYDVHWYKFAVTQNQIYYVWWNDKDQGDGTKSTDVEGFAFYSDGGSISGWTSGVDKGWTTAKSFTSTITGTVYVRLQPYTGNATNVGTFGVVYSTTNTRPEREPINTSPLINGVWRDGEFATGGATLLTYTFDVENGKTYYVWWNDSSNGPTPKDKTVDITVSAKYSGASTYIFGNGTTGGTVDHGFGNASFFTASQTGTVSLEVRTYYAGRTGTYGIAFSTIGIRPGSVVPSGTLSANQWKDSTIAHVDDIHEYTINVDQNQPYYIWWDDRSTSSSPQSLGSGTKAADVQVRASYSDETIIFVTGSSTYNGQWVDAGWATPQSFTATRTGTVSVRLRPYNSNASSVGTYGIVFSTGSTMPLKDSATLISVTPVGSPTTALTLLFDKAVSGLSANDITLSMSGPFGVTKGDLSGTGPSYTLGVSSPINGTLTVTMGSPLLNITGSPKEVTVSGDGSITVTPLVENEWEDGGITSLTQVDWYSITASAAGTYYIWWNDKAQGPDPKDKTGDVTVGAWYNGAYIFGGTTTTEDNGWDTAKSITLPANGTAYVRVRMYGDSNTNYFGTYGVVYSSVNSRPVIKNPDDVPVTLNTVSAVAGTPTASLTLVFDKAITGLSAADITLTMPGLFDVTKGTLSGSGPSYTLGVSSLVDGNVTVTVAKTGYDITGSSKQVNINGAGIPELTEGQWTDGTLSAGSSVDWYRITVTAGTAYYVWWNGSWKGDDSKSKTADAVVSAWYANGNNIFGDNENAVNNGWDSASTIPASNPGGTVYIRVKPYQASDSYKGTYGIVFSTTNTMPDL